MPSASPPHADGSASDGGAGSAAKRSPGGSCDLPAAPRRVDWDAVLGYARRFAEYDIIQRIRPDSDRIHVPVARLARPVDDARVKAPPPTERVGPLAVGMDLCGFSVTDLSLRDGLLRLAVERRAGDQVLERVPLGVAPAGRYRDATPLDRPGLSVWYEATDVAWSVVEGLGRELGERVAVGVGERGAAEAFADWERAIAPRRPRTASLDDSDRIEIRPDGKMYLRVSDSCQERCVFCFFFDTADVDNLMRHHDFEAALQAIDPAAISQVVLTGGEATLHPRLPDYIELLHRRGFSEIILQTNGIVLSEPGYLERLLPYRDRIGIGVSLHASTAETNDLVTSARRDYFPKKLRALRRAAALGFTLKVVYVLSRRNLHETVSAVELVEETTRGTDVHMQFTFPSFEGRMSLFIETYPLLAEVGAHLPHAFRRARELDLRLSMNHQCQVPPCVVPEDVQHLESLWFAETPVGMWSAAERAWGPSCERCAMRPHCSGVWKEYAERFDLTGLRPYGADEVPPRPRDAAAHRR